MLKIFLEAETGADEMNPLTVANAVIQLYVNDESYGPMDNRVDQLDEVADHITRSVLSYRRRMRREQEDAKNN